MLDQSDALMLVQFPWSEPEQSEGQHTLIPLFALSVQAAGNWPLTKWENMGRKDTVIAKFNFSKSILNNNAAKHTAW